LGYLGVIIGVVVIILFIFEIGRSDIIKLIKYILLGLAILFTLYGFFVKKIQYTFTGADIDKNLWTMGMHGFVHQSEIEKFITTVKEKL